MAEIRGDDSPLSDEMLARVEQSLVRVNRLADWTQRIHECGFDCRAEESYRRAIAERLQALLNKFGREMGRR